MGDGNGPSSHICPTDPSRSLLLLLVLLSWLLLLLLLLYLWFLTKFCPRLILRKACQKVEGQWERALSSPFQPFPAFTGQEDIQPQQLSASTYLSIFWKVKNGIKPSPVPLSLSYYFVQFSFLSFLFLGGLLGFLLLFSLSFFLSFLIFFLSISRNNQCSL